MIQCHRTYCKSRGFLLLPKLLIFSCQQLTTFSVIAARSLAVKISSSLRSCACQQLPGTRLLLHSLLLLAFISYALILLPLLCHWPVVGPMLSSSMCAGPLRAWFRIREQVMSQHCRCCHQGSAHSAWALELHFAASCGFAQKRNGKSQNQTEFKMFLLSFTLVMKPDGIFLIPAMPFPMCNSFICNGISPIWHQHKWQ